MTIFINIVKGDRGDCKRGGGEAEVAYWFPRVLFVFSVPYPLPYSLLPLPVHHPAHHHHKLIVHVVAVVGQCCRTVLGKVHNIFYYLCPEIYCTRYIDCPNDSLQPNMGIFSHNNSSKKPDKICSILYIKVEMEERRSRISLR